MHILPCSYQAQRCLLVRVIDGLQYTFRRIPKERNHKIELVGIATFPGELAVANITHVISAGQLCTSSRKNERTCGEAT